MPVRAGCARTTLSAGVPYRRRRDRRLDVPAELEHRHALWVPEQLSPFRASQARGALSLGLRQQPLVAGPSVQRGPIPAAQQRDVNSERLRVDSAKEARLLAAPLRSV